MFFRLCLNPAIDQLVLYIEHRRTDAETKFDRTESKRLIIISLTREYTEIYSLISMKPWSQTLALTNTFDIEFCLSIIIQTEGAKTRKSEAFKVWG